MHSAKCTHQIGFLLYPSVVYVTENVLESEETLHTVGRTLVCWTVNVWVCVLMHADTVCVVWINVSTPFIGLDSLQSMCFTTQHNITLQVSLKPILHPKWPYFGETMSGRSIRFSERRRTSGDV